MKEVICTCCPQGCHLQVDEANDYKVTGNGCPNGITYGKEELTHPTRIITSTVRITGGLYPRCPVKTAQAVPKETMFSVMAALASAAASPRRQPAAVHPCAQHLRHLRHQPGAPTPGRVVAV